MTTRDLTLALARQLYGDAAEARLAALEAELQAEGAGPLADWPAVIAA